SSSRRSRTQQKNRRKDGLFRKAAKYSIICGAHAFVFLRIKSTGQIYIFNSELGWPPSKEEL
ncbi:hypothetical protein BGW36DRAFT_276532, partial [Talaromyces proteolyticus]